MPTIPSGRGGATLRGKSPTQVLLHGCITSYLSVNNFALPRQTGRCHGDFSTSCVIIWLRVYHKRCVPGKPARRKFLHGFISRCLFMFASGRPGGASDQDSENRLNKAKRIRAHNHDNLLDCAVCSSANRSDQCLCPRSPRAPTRSMASIPIQTPGSATFCISGMHLQIHYHVVSNTLTETRNCSDQRSGVPRPLRWNTPSGPTQMIVPDLKRLPIVELTIRLRSSLKRRIFTTKKTSLRQISTRASQLPESRCE